MFSVPVTPSVPEYPLHGAKVPRLLYGQNSPSMTRSDLVSVIGPPTHDNVFGNGYGTFTHGETYQPWMSADVVTLACNYREGLRKGMLILVQKVGVNLINGYKMPVYDVFMEKESFLGPDCALGIISGDIVSTSKQSKIVYVPFAFQNCVEYFPQDKESQKIMQKPAGTRFHFGASDADPIMCYLNVNDLASKQHTIVDAVVVTPSSAPGSPAVVCLYGPRVFCPRPSLSVGGPSLFDILLRNLGGFADLNRSNETTSRTVFSEFSPDTVSAQTVSPGQSDASPRNRSDTFIRRAAPQVPTNELNPERTTRAQRYNDSQPETENERLRQTAG